MCAEEGLCLSLSPFLVSLEEKRVPADLPMLKPVAEVLVPAVVEGLEWLKQSAEHSIVLEEERILVPALAKM
jgi:hypothetical protein